MFQFIPVAVFSIGFIIPAAATTVTIGASAPTTALTSIFGPSLAGTSPGVWSGSFLTGTANTNIINRYLDPLAGNGYYAYAESGQTITANFASGINSLNLLWGSPDTYNTITFYSGLNATGTSEAYSPGSGPLAGLTPTQTGGTLVSFSTTSVWDSVTFYTSGNSFEFAATVPGTPVFTPEPATVTLLGGGLLMVGVGALRRRKL